MVYIHTGTEGVHAVGHMTFCFEGLMYSYGNYAKKEEKLAGTLGPAVFFTVLPEVYINNSCIYEGTTLYGFGLILTDRQKDTLRNTLGDMMNSMVRWACPLQQDPQGWQHPNNGSPTTPAGCSGAPAANSGSLPEDSGRPTGSWAPTALCLPRPS